MIPRTGDGTLRYWCLICDKKFCSDQGWRVHMGKMHRLAWKLRPYLTRAEYLYAMSLEGK